MMAPAFAADVDKGVFLAETVATVKAFKCQSDLAENPRPGMNKSASDPVELASLGLAPGTQ